MILEISHSNYMTANFPFHLLVILAISITNYWQLEYRNLTFGEWN